jgi:hypothetical protein
MKIMEYNNDFEKNLTIKTCEFQYGRVGVLSMQRHPTLPNTNLIYKLDDKNFNYKTQDNNKLLCELTCTNTMHEGLTLHY